MELNLEAFFNIKDIAITIMGGGFAVWVGVLLKLLSNAKSDQVDNAYELVKAQFMLKQAGITADEEQAILNKMAKLNKTFTKPTILHD